MRRLRVCIYGGTNLEPQAQALISSVAYKLIEQMSVVIVTGGFLRSQEEPQAVSTDLAVLEGARRYAHSHGKDLKECFQAWVPEPVLDKRPELKPIRMTPDQGIAVHVVRGRTPLGRRLSMVAAVDMVVTISGKRHTEVVVEQSLDLGIPVLPIPDFGGDSKELLSKYRERIGAAFAAHTLDQCLSTITRFAIADPGAAAAGIVDLLRTAKVGKCLILLPYDGEHKQIYGEVIEPAVSRHMLPVRLDRLAQSEAIYSSFADAIRSCSGVIADITRLNRNVMYEIGFAHGQGIVPLIFSRDVSRLQRLPVYFKTLNIHLVNRELPLAAIINEYLTCLKDARRRRTIPE